MDLTTLLYIALFIVSLYWLLSSFSKPRNFPPGPPKLPLIGSVPFLSTKDKKHRGDSLIRNQELVQKYGKTFGFFIANQPFVIFSDYEIMKEVFRKDTTTYRPSNR